VGGFFYRDVAPLALRNDLYCWLCAMTRKRIKRGFWRSGEKRRCWCWFIEWERPVLQKVNDKKMDDRKMPLDGLLIFMSSIFLSTLPGCDPDVGDAAVGVLIWRRI
jgi:hypothetical protein